MIAVRKREKDVSHRRVEAAAKGGKSSKTGSKLQRDVDSSSAFPISSMTGFLPRPFLIKNNLPGGVLPSIVQSAPELCNCRTDAWHGRLSTYLKRIAVQHEMRRISSCDWSTNALSYFTTEAAQRKHCGRGKSPHMMMLGKTWRRKHTLADKLFNLIIATPSANSTIGYGKPSLAVPKYSRPRHVIDEQRREAQPLDVAARVAQTRRIHAVQTRHETVFSVGGAPCFMDRFPRWETDVAPVVVPVAVSAT